MRNLVRQARNAEGWQRAGWLTSEKVMQAVAAATEQEAVDDPRGASCA